MYISEQALSACGDFLIANDAMISRIVDIALFVIAVFCMTTLIWYLFTEILVPAALLFFDLLDLFCVKIRILVKRMRKAQRNWHHKRKVKRVMKRMV